MKIWKDFAPVWHLSTGESVLDMVCHHYAFVMKGELIRRGIDIPIFSSYVYAFDLFAQTVYTFKSILCTEGETKDSRWSRYPGEIDHASSNSFPSVTGLLSMWRIRICPAVLPMMLNYVHAPDAGEWVSGEQWEEAYCHNPNRSRSNSLEREVWVANESIISDAVKCVKLSTAEHIKAFPQPMSDAMDVTAVQDMYQLQHDVLDKKIRSMDDSNRLLNSVSN